MKAIVYPPQAQCASRRTIKLNSSTETQAGEFREFVFRCQRPSDHGGPHTVPLAVGSPAYAQFLEWDGA